MPVFAHAYSDEYATPKTWLEGYRPNYFLYGNTDSKIQLSTKVQLLEDAHLYFAYSQTMFWDIGEVSSPMADVNFNPELFYRFENGSNDAPRSWFDVGLLEHESNGRDGLSSRAWNRSYVRYTLESRYDAEVRVYSSFKAWIPWTSSFDAYNKDLLYDRGLYELELTVANLLGGPFVRDDLTLRLYAGGPSHLNPFLGGQEITLRFAVRGRTHAFIPLWTLQVFNGYGEDLLTYNQRRTIFRLGLSY